MFFILYIFPICLQHIISKLILPLYKIFWSNIQLILFKEGSVKKIKTKEKLHNIKIISIPNVFFLHLNEFPLACLLDSFSFFLILVLYKEKNKKNEKNSFKKIKVVLPLELLHLWGVENENWVWSFKLTSVG